MLTRRIATTAIGLLMITLVVVGLRTTSGGDDGYRVDLMMDNAAALNSGTPVYVNGQEAGQVTGVELDGARARVGIELDDKRGPLTEGARAFVRWKSVLGERVVEIQSGSPDADEIADGAEMSVVEEQVDLDEVLAALDPATRKHLQGTLTGLRQSLPEGSQDLSALLKYSGPALNSLGGILDAVGEDDDAIKDLVVQLNSVVTPLAGKDDELAASVDDLTGFTETVAGQEKGLTTTLEQLPETLDAANSTFDAVGPAVREAAPLLRDLRPVSAKLTSVSRRLAPILIDLRPAISNLRPVLIEVDDLLGTTPDLLDNSHGVMPGLTGTVDALAPAVDFLRPYVPDLVGWLSNWGSGFSYYDAQAHYARAVVRVGPQAFDENPGAPLTVDFDPAPAPGTAGREPWTDANGSTMR